MIKIKISIEMMPGMMLRAKIVRKVSSLSPSSHNSKKAASDPISAPAPSIILWKPKTKPLEPLGVEALISASRGATR